MHSLDAHKRMNRTLSMQKAHGSDCESAVQLSASNRRIGYSEAVTVRKEETLA